MAPSEVERSSSSTGPVGAMKLCYLANARIPTSKAYGLQIFQNCEAFARNGATVTLYVPQRGNTRRLRPITDPWAHYGVAREFPIHRVRCFDLHRSIRRLAGPLATHIRSIAYGIALVPLMAVTRADVYYARDPTTLLTLSLFKSRHTLAYEVHQLAKRALGRWMQRACVRRAGTVIAVTSGLAERMRDLGAIRVVVAHDGYRADRFAVLPDRVAARTALDLPHDAFIVGYVGRLRTMQMSKGVDILIDAASRTERPITVCLVGGPAKMSEVLRARWLAHNLPAERFIAPGEVAPSAVPNYIAAFDVCTMPTPWTEHFAYYASPLKLFEYMAAGGTIVCTDLPSTTEIVRGGETALLVPPSDVSALADALCKLYDDPALRQRLARNAKRAASDYTWDARAREVLRALGAQK